MRRMYSDVLSNTKILSLKALELSTVPATELVSKETLTALRELIQANDDEAKAARRKAKYLKIEVSFVSDL